MDGVDRLPGLIDTFADQLGEDVDLPGDLIRLVRAIPSYYLRYFYLTERMVKEQGEHPTRAAAIYNHALATGFARGFLVAAGIALLTLAINIAVIRLRRADLAGTQQPEPAPPAHPAPPQ